jgi:WD40 repeat protein
LKRTSRIFPGQGGGEVLRIEGALDSVFLIRFSPDQLDPVRKARGGEDAASISFSESGNYLSIALPGEGSVRTWDLRNYQYHIHTGTRPNVGIETAIDGKGLTIITHSAQFGKVDQRADKEYQAQVRRVDFATKAIESHFLDEDSRENANFKVFGFSANGDRLLTSVTVPVPTPPGSLFRDLKRQIVTVWDRQGSGYSPTRKIPLSPSLVATSATISPDGRTMALTGHPINGILLFDLQKVQHVEPVWDIAGKAMKRLGPEAPSPSESPTLALSSSSGEFPKQI